MRTLRLRREVGLTGATLYGLGIIIGAGIYSLIGEAASTSGNALWFAFVIAAVVSAFTGLSYAELATLLPRSGAEYFYVKHAFKNDAFAFIVGWIVMFIEIIAGSTVALGFGGYFHELTGVGEVASAVSLVLALAIINFSGIRKSVRLNVVFTLLAVLGLLVIIFSGLRAFGSVDYFEMSAGFEGIISSVGVVFFAYLGFEDLANLSEEIKQPRRNLPRAIIFSLAIATLLYILVAVAAVSLAPWREMAESGAPLALVGSKAGVGEEFIIFIALAATISTVLVFQIASSRMLYGMTRDRVFPEFFARVHAKRGTPYISIATVTLISILFILTGEIRTVALLTDLGAFIVFSLVNLSVIVMRYKAPDLKRPFRVPLNIGSFPLVSLFGLVSCLAMMTSFSKDIVLGQIALILSGALLYIILRKKT